MKNGRPDPCRCPTEADALASGCRRAGLPMRSTNYRICSATGGYDADTSDAFRRLWDGLPQADDLRARELRCRHRGGDTGQTAGCAPCGGKTRLKVFACGSAARGVPTCTDADCRGCPHHEPVDSFYPLPGDPPCGVVVGSYGYPRLIELQIRAIRHHCGDVPILVSDDLSPGALATQIEALAGAYPGVDVQTSLRRIGHAGGDFAAFGRGLKWAAGRGLKVLAKLSQRFVLDWPRWLQDGARGLLKSGRPTGGQPCIEGGLVFPIRSEAVLLDVQRWQRADVLRHLRPRRLGHACENALWRAASQLGELWPWEVMGRDRFRRSAGVLWHVSTPAEAYHALARRLGVALDDDFTVAGNHLRADYLVG